MGTYYEQEENTYLFTRARGRVLTYEEVVFKQFLIYKPRLGVIGLHLTHG